ncbi:uncharacterized protein LOC6565989 [Drosophila grimshawi]|uniref:GH24856 n=1 Tax=Drosophila grimshawi TaxID=7222 RepID=B4JNP2_DROGR|nr:uncharacterized protein LOC6565989 [Drosophila grimshawi]EDV92335.1 GH24856 [Drosophila grimshawi]
MAHMWQMVVNLMGWMMGHRQEHDQGPVRSGLCDANDIGLPEISDIGTVISINKLPVGQFIGVNLIPSQATRGPGSNQLERRKLLLDKWRDALSPTQAEEAEWQEMSMHEEHFTDARDV